MPDTTQRSHRQSVCHKPIARQLVWLAALAATTGCEAFGVDPPGGAACTLIGCQDGLQVQLQRSGPWPAGEYTLQVMLDDQPAVSCAVSLPFASVTTAATCSSADVQLQTSGQALSADQHALTAVWIRSTPAKARLVLQHNTATLLDQTLQPTYQTSRPNGPDCKPECTQATASVAVP